MSQQFDGSKRISYITTLLTVGNEAKNRKLQRLFKKHGLDVFCVSNEANNLLRIGRGHPCVVDMMDVFIDKRATLLYIAMEYYPGGDLEKYRLSRPGGFLNKEDLKIVASSLFGGLKHIHANFMVSV